MTTEIKELTVGRYEWFKEKGRSDASIAKQYDMDHNQLHKWKKEKDLIGKDYGLRGGRQGALKTVQIQDEESPELLKDNKIPEERLKASYTPNKAIQEKLAEKKPEAKESEPTVINVKESDFLVPESSDNGTIAEIPSLPSESLTESKTHELVQEAKAAPEYYEAFKQTENPVEFKMPEVNDLIEPDYQKEIERLKAELHIAKCHEYILKVNDAVKFERYRQNSLYGHQRRSHGDWLMILTEEVGEVAQAMQKSRGWGKETDADNLYEELIHVAAVASAIAEQVLEERE